MDAADWTAFRDRPAWPLTGTAEERQLVRAFNAWLHGPGTGGITHLIRFPDEIRRPLLVSDFDRDRALLERPA